jgi:hypothetical protein
LRFFFFGFLGFTGAVGVRVEDGEMPPVLAPWPELLELFGPVPPDCDELDCVLAPSLPLPLPPDGAAVPPFEAHAAADPQAMAIARTATASVRRTRMHPCMGLGIGPLPATV